MPLRVIVQPESIKITENLRLRRPSKEDWKYALPWYQDKEVLYYSEGVEDKLYDLDTINKMYNYLSKIGELYFIEVKEEDSWISIGDVTVSEKCMPIVIGDKNYRRRGIGKKVLEKLVERAEDMGINKIKLKGIYKYNERSKKLFTSIGFYKTSEDEKSEYYELVL